MGRDVSLVFSMKSWFIWEPWEIKESASHKDYKTSPIYFIQ